MKAGARSARQDEEFWMVLLDSNNLVVGWSHSKKKVGQVNYFFKSLFCKNGQHLDWCWIFCKILLVWLWNSQVCLSNGHFFAYVSAGLSVVHWSKVTLPSCPLPRSPQVAKPKGWTLRVFRIFSRVWNANLGENTYIGQIHFIFQSVLHSFGLDEIEGTQIETLGPRLHHGLAKQVGIPISWYKHNCNVTNDSNAQFEAFIATDISYGGFHFNRATPFIIHDKPSSYWGTSISGNSHIM